MAIALTPFTGLCGFMPLDQIALHLSSTPEFAALIPNSTFESFLSIASSTTPTGPKEKAALKDIFSALMTADEFNIKDQSKKLMKRFADEDVKETEKGIKDLILRLDGQFPGDVGVFCPFMLNYVQLTPGESMFLGAGEPHAYVSGGTLIPLIMYQLYFSFIILRYDGVHGELRQCDSRWSDAKAQRHPESRLRSHLLCISSI
jgi:mannose-6-phosphate isomerase